MSLEVRRVGSKVASATGSIAPPAGLSIPKVRPDALLYALVLFSWVAVWRIQDLFPILGSIKFPILIELVALGLFFANQTYERQIKWIIKSPILIITLSLLAIMVVGLPFSLWPGKGFTFITRDFLPTLVLMVILATSLRERSDLEWFAFAHLLGAMLYAFIVFLSFDVGPHGRLGGLVYYDANDLAMLMVCTLPFAIFFLRPGVPVWKRLIALLAVLLFVVMIIRTGSRGGFLGMIAVMSYILLRYKSIPVRLRLGAVAGGATLLLAVGSSNYWEMMATLLNPKEDYNMTDETGRSAVWKRGIGYMFSHPVLGVGVRAFPQAEGMLSETAKRYAERGRGIKWSVAHNSFVEIGAELGIGGLVLFISMLFIAMRDSARVGKGPRGSPASQTAIYSAQTADDSAYAQMLIASFVGYIVCGSFVSAEYFSYLYVLLALVIGQQAVLRRRALKKPQQRVHPPMNNGKGMGTRNPGRVVARPVQPHWLPTGS
jgi:O-antigen ligase